MVTYAEGVLENIEATLRECIAQHNCNLVLLLTFGYEHFFGVDLFIIYCMY